jgi:hypothetical protein
LLSSFLLNGFELIDFFKLEIDSLLFNGLFNESFDSIEPFFTVEPFDLSPAVDFLIMLDFAPTFGDFLSESNPSE